MTEEVKVEEEIASYLTEDDYRIIIKDSMQRNIGNLMVPRGMILNDHNLLDNIAKAVFARIYKHQKRGGNGTH